MGDVFGEFDEVVDFVEEGGVGVGGVVGEGHDGGEVFFFGVVLDFAEVVGEGFVGFLFEV